MTKGSRGFPTSLKCLSSLSEQVPAYCLGREICNHGARDWDWYRQYREFFLNNRRSKALWRHEEGDRQGSWQGWWWWGRWGAVVPGLGRRRGPSAYSMYWVGVGAFRLLCPGGGQRRVAERQMTHLQWWPDLACSAAFRPAPLFSAEHIGAVISKSKGGFPVLEFRESARGSGLISKGSWPTLSLSLPSPEPSMPCNYISFRVGFPWLHKTGHTFGFPWLHASIHH